jgi:spore coat protein U-like protein
MSSMSGSRSAIEPRRRLWRRLAACFGAWMLCCVAVWPAAGACSGLAFSSLPGTVNWLGSGGSVYAVFDPTDRIQPVNFSIKKRSGTCSVFVTASLVGGDTFTTRQLRSGGGNTLGFNLYVDSTHKVILRDLPSAGPNDVLNITFGSGANTATATYYFYIPPLQVASPGTYQALMQFSLYQGTVISNTLAQTAEVVHQAVVAADTELSFVAAGQPFDPTRQSTSLDFGVLNTGGTGLRQVNGNLQVRTNTGYLVSLQSQNKGALRLTTPGDSSAIKYTLTINGLTPDLSWGIPVPVAFGLGKTPANGISLPLTISIDPSQADVAQASAGTYSDVVTVLVAGE